MVVKIVIWYGPDDCYACKRWAEIRAAMANGNVQEALMVNMKAAIRRAPSRAVVTLRVIVGHGE